MKLADSLQRVEGTEYWDMRTGNFTTCSNEDWLMAEGQPNGEIVFKAAGEPFIRSRGLEPQRYMAARQLVTVRVLVRSALENQYRTLAYRGSLCQVERTRMER